jgi:hypothetical protein
MSNRKSNTIALTIWLVLLVAVVTFFFQLPFPAHAEPIDQYQEGWSEVRVRANEDAATAPSFTTTGDYADLPSNVFTIPSFTGDLPGSRVTAGDEWYFTFPGTVAADRTFAYTLVGWASTNGMAQVICQGTGILGTQTLSSYPNGVVATNGFWADTLTVAATTKWPDTPIVYNSTNNEVAMLNVNLAGIRHIKFYFHDTDGTLEADIISVFGRRK